MPDVRLPGTLTPLFPGLPRRLEIEAASVLGAIDELEGRWPGLRDRLVAEGPSLRNHIHVYVDGERAGLDTPVEERSRLDVIAAISGGSPAAPGSRSLLHAHRVVPAVDVQRRTGHVPGAVAEQVRGG